MEKPIFIPFGEWLPDLPPTNNPGATEARNVFPLRGFYKPVTKQTNLSLAGVNSTLADVVVGNAVFGTTNLAGTRTNIYTYSVPDFTYRHSPNYALAPNTYWEFVKWGESAIYAVTGENTLSGTAMQKAYGSGGLSFGPAVGGAAGIYARTIAIIRDFVVVGNITQTTSASGTYSQRVRWSGINNPDTWTADAATLADFQDLVGDGGDVVKVIGGDYGTILQENAIWRMTFVGAPLVFQFDKIHNNIGAITNRAAIGYQNKVFFISKQGFFMFDGINLKAIGEGKVNNTFFKALGTATSAEYSIKHSSVKIHPDEPLVLWAFADSNASSATIANTIYAYNWEEDKWSSITSLSIRDLATFAISFGLSGESILLNRLAAYNANGTNASMFSVFDNDVFPATTKSSMTALVETKEFQIFPGQRAQITELRGVVHGLSASYTLAMVARNSLTESISVGTAVAPLSSGSVPVRSEGRYHRVRLVTSSNYDLLQGIEVVDATPTGKR